MVAVVKKWYGKYRAFVVDVNDPEKRGRIRVKCPKVLREAKSSWCEPCIPVAYDYGGDFCMPRINEAIWVEFEDGDVKYPIWSGGWWARDKSPLTDYSDVTKVRVIEYNGVRIDLKENSLVLSMGGNIILEIQPDEINSSVVINTPD